MCIRDRVYSVDLFGAAAGCLGSLLLLNNTDGPSGVLWVSVMAAAASMCFAWGKIKIASKLKPVMLGVLSKRGTIFVLLFFAASLNSVSDYGLQPLVSKGTFEGGESYLFREWNTFSRVVVGPTRVSRPHMWGPSPKLDAERFNIEQRLM